MFLQLDLCRTFRKTQLLVSHYADHMLPKHGSWLFHVPFGLQNTGCTTPEGHVTSHISYAFLSQGPIYLLGWLRTPPEWNVGGHRVTETLNTKYRIIYLAVLQDTKIIILFHVENVKDHRSDLIFAENINRRAKDALFAIQSLSKFYMLFLIFLNYFKEKHQENMSMKTIHVPPSTLPLYSETGVYRGIPFFLSFGPKNF